VKIKIVVLIIVIFGCLYSHYCNHHFILQSGKKIESFSGKYKGEKDKNLRLLAENSNLCSRERIQNLAITKLNMFCPKNTDNVHTIFINDDKTFRFVNYIVPSAEALTK